MASNTYEFVSHWKVSGTVPAVYAILIDGSDFPRWWPQVYLAVRETDPGGEHGLGKRGELLTRGWLPYTLRWSMLVTETRYPSGFTLVAEGDFVGTGVWQFEQNGTDVNIRFDWKLRAEKPLLRWLSFLFKPVFSANHRWAMARGEEALRAELDRRLYISRGHT